MRVWARAAAWAMWLLASLPSEPSGPGGRPRARAAAARRAVHCATRARVSTRAISWRTSGSDARPVATALLDDEIGSPGALRIPLVGLGGHGLLDRRLTDHAATGA